jgi:preprotein translocase subunit SecG
MKALLRAISVIHAIMAALFAAAAMLLIVMATHKAWVGVSQGLVSGAAQQVIEAIGYLAAAVVALQISQTIAEEEVIRAAHVSGPTRVRRFLSRFLVVLIVALAIEGLVVIFRGAHEDPASLPGGASILYGTAALLAAWGVFIRLNRYAEELEPEAMEEAKQEDAKLR